MSNASEVLKVFKRCVKWPRGGESVQEVWKVFKRCGKWPRGVESVREVWKVDRRWGKCQMHPSCYKCSKGV